MKQEQEIDELTNENEDPQEKLAKAEGETEQLRKDLERERQVDMLPERSQIAALKDENERLHRELEKIRDKQKDKQSLLETELDQLRKDMKNKQMSIEKLQTMRDVDDREIIDLTSPVIANRDPEVKERVVFLQAVIEGQQKTLDEMRNEYNEAFQDLEKAEKISCDCLLDLADRLE